MDGFRYFNDSWSRPNFKANVDIVHVRKRGLGLKERSIYKRTEAKRLLMETWEQKRLGCALTCCALTLMECRVFGEQGV